MYSICIVYVSYIIGSIAVAAYRGSAKKVALNEWPVSGSRIVSLIVRVWAFPVRPIRGLKAAGQLRGRVIAFVTVERRNLVESGNCGLVHQLVSIIYDPADVEATAENQLRILY